jgi:hypothetical protein
MFSVSGDQEQGQTKGNKAVPRLAEETFQGPENNIIA